MMMKAANKTGRGARKLVYVTAMDIGIKTELLKLDVNPEIKTRSEHNMKIDWQKALRERQQQRPR